jgi:hypothetical protein
LRLVSDSHLFIGELSLSKSNLFITEPSLGADNRQSFTGKVRQVTAPTPAIHSTENTSHNLNSPRVTRTLILITPQ